MRQFTYTLAIFLVFLTSFSTLASSNFEVEIKSDHILSVKINNLLSADKLILKDSNDETLFTEKSLSQPYLKHISFENLPYGTYMLYLDDAYKVSSKTIIKTTSGIIVSDAGVAFKPNFKHMDADAKKVIVAFSNPLMELTHFKVYDPKGNLIIQLENSDVAFNRILNFSDVPSGEYSVAFQTKERSFFRSITIK